MDEGPDDLDRLRRAAPVRDAELDTPPVREALAALLAELPGPPARRGRGRRLALGLGVVAAMAVAAPAAADALGLYTGIFGDPGMTENDAGQFLDVTAPEFPAFARGLVAHLPLPAGTSLDAEIEGIRAGGGLAQASGVAGQLALATDCRWLAEWHDAAAAGDAGRAAAAVEVLRAAPDWPEIAAVDGGGVADRLRRFADAAAAGDAAAVADGYAAACGGVRP